ncbi:MAG: sugar ABC transporter ATP-binding protein [Spirochaetaceae bacterium]|jgi:ribose transport system ATP-binding protein|nr:sugar ABC transporter ATP-binding protein [Spirochaetaceae bacterium]
MDAPILRLSHIKKVYPGVVALDDVSLDFYAGEVHAIAGENGAGKSTFIKVVTGAISPTAGEVYYQGDLVRGNTPAKSLKAGIAAIYQEFNLFPFLSVAENVFYGRYPAKGIVVDFKKMEKETRELLSALNVDIDPSAQVKNLSVGYQQIVEIAKAVSMNAKVLIMDEPSAPLTENEVDSLFAIVRKVREQGVAVIYISHRLEEIFAITDKVSVFRDGKYIQTLNTRDTNTEEIVRLMVNRELGEQYPQKDYERQDEALEVRGLTTALLRDVSFKAYRGEILGLAGLVGAGRTETARAIFGADKITSGEILINGKKAAICSPIDAIRHGIGLIPEDRKRQGVFLNLSIQENITYANLGGISHGGVISRGRDIKAGEEYRNLLNIKAASLAQLVKNLSGGNQQKVVLAKWLFTRCGILLFDEPTRGIDVGAKQEIYILMKQMVNEGKVVIMISSEMPELLGMADRIIVMREGRITGTLSRAEATQEKVLKLAAGL